MTEQEMQHISERQLNYSALIVPKAATEIRRLQEQLCVAREALKGIASGECEYCLRAERADEARAPVTAHGVFLFVEPGCRLSAALGPSRSACAEHVVVAVSAAGQSCRTIEVSRVAATSIAICVGR